MPYLLSLLLGFAVSGIGVIPPGLLNMTALRISLNEGAIPVRKFVSGAVTVIVLECWLALIFARYLGRHPEIILLLREIALAVFLCLAVYFFFGTGKKNSETVGLPWIKTGSWFFIGIFYSVLNFLTVPFYVAISLTLRSYELFWFEKGTIAAFLVGVAFGASFGFYCFVHFFRRMENYMSGVIKNMNYVIGAVLLAVAVLTLINILQYYYR